MFSKAKNTIAPRVVAALTMIAMSTTACSQLATPQPSAGEASGAVGPVKVKLGVFALNDAAVILLGKDKGIFSKHNIDLEISSTATDAISQSVVSGQVDMALDSAVHNMIAASKGLSLKFVSGVTTWLPGESGRATNGLITAKQGGPATGAELNGKTVAVVALGSAAQLSVQAFVDKSGGDSSTIKFTTLPQTAMGAAVEANQVAAAQLTDPYYSQEMATGKFSNLGDPSAEAFGAAPRITVVTSAKYASANPATIGNFQQAMREAAEYSKANAGEIPSVLTSYFDTPADVAKDAALPQIKTDIDLMELDKLQGIMLKYGSIKEKSDVNDLMASAK